MTIELGIGRIKASFRSRLIAACLASLIFFMLWPAPAAVHADIAPPDPARGTNPVPGAETTQVRMLAESVILEIETGILSREGYARVTATFQMRNLGDTLEQMEVRFPLDQTYHWGNLCQQPNPAFPPINDLKAQVDGRQVATYKTYQTIVLPVEQEPRPTITIPCWEHFSVAFPPGQEVTIQVTYTAQPYDNYKVGGYFEYSYILETGAGWKGTIGQADIIVRYPYELNQQNFYGCGLPECTLSTNEVRWHFEDFEPDYYSNITTRLMKPHLWQQIVLETANTRKNPSDGEAWGRLGKAYKQAVMNLRGFLSEPPGPEMYRLSEQAYQKAVALLPGDADWHYGYAELLCHNAEWNYFTKGYSQAHQQAWAACLGQLKQALDIEPAHEKTHELLAKIAEFEPAAVDLSGVQPVFLFLTSFPTATATHKATSTARPTPTKRPALAPPAPTQTPEATPSKLPIQTLPVSVKTQAPVFTQALEQHTAPSAPDPRMTLYLGVAIFIVIVSLGILLRARRK